ncbi:MAG: ABC transporter ATP-binding protein [Dehalococcoidia bacterium]
MQESISTSNAPILQVKELVKQFGGNRAVDHATFDVENRSITGLIGPNGAGKTTCFNCIAGALSPNDGSVIFDEYNITGLPPYRIFDRSLIRTFQIPQELAQMSVLENLMLARKGQDGERLWQAWLHPNKIAIQENELQESALEILDLVDLYQHAHETAASLSGGQRKLLELARALMGQPRMILLDEPSAGVNPTLARKLSEHIEMIRSKLGITFLLISHDMDIIERICDKVIVMTSGHVLVEGTANEVFSNSEVQNAYLGSQYR